LNHQKAVVMPKPLILPPSSCTRLYLYYDIKSYCAVCALNDVGRLMNHA